MRSASPGASAVSWSDSEDERLHKHEDETDSIIRKRAHQSLAISDPTTPNRKRVRQLETPPDTISRKHRKETSGLDTNYSLSSPSKRGKNTDTDELLQALNGKADMLGALGDVNLQSLAILTPKAFKLQAHILRQDRLLEANHRSKETLRQLLASKESQFLDMREKMQFYECERETQKATILSLRRRMAPPNKN